VERHHIDSLTIRSRRRPFPSFRRTTWASSSSDWENILAPFLTRLKALVDLLKQGSEHVACLRRSPMAKLNLRARKKAIEASAFYPRPLACGRGSSCYLRMIGSASTSSLLSFSRPQLKLSSAMASYVDQVLTHEDFSLSDKLRPSMYKIPLLG
jgi:hypothetical protein